MKPIQAVSQGLSRIMRNGRDIAAIVRTNTRKHEREKTAQRNWRGELLRARAHAVSEDLS
jgi:ribosomal protein L39E